METVFPIFACFWALALLAGVVLWLLSILIITNLKDVFPDDYIEAGSPRLLFPFTGYSDFGRYLLGKRYGYLPDKSLVRMCHVARVLYLYCVLCFIIFLAGMIIGVIYMYAKDWPF